MYLEGFPPLFTGHMFYAALRTSQHSKYKMEYKASKIFYFVVFLSDTITKQERYNIEDYRSYK